MLELLCKSFSHHKLATQKNQGNPSGFRVALGRIPKETSCFRWKRKRGYLMSTQLKLMLWALDITKLTISPKVRTLTISSMIRLYRKCMLKVSDFQRRQGLIRTEIQTGIVKRKKRVLIRPFRITIWRAMGEAVSLLRKDSRL